MSKLAVIVLAAGQGTRMKSAKAKVMHAVAGLPILGHVMAAARGAGAEREDLGLSRGWWHVRGIRNDCFHQSGAVRVSAPGAAIFQPSHIRPAVSC